jgi:glycosyltransferase involved in cell wall biosynthesis
MKTVTIVVPTHNRPQLLRQTLKSIERQRFVDHLDVILVDDGSANAADVTRAVKDFSGIEIEVIRHDKPLGLSAARNRGIAAATSEWIGFCDDDDLWAPEKVAAQLTAATMARCGWAYAGAVNITLEGVVIGGAPPLPPRDVVRQLPMRNAIPGGGSGVIVHKDLLTRAGVFDDCLPACEDWDMWLRLSRLEPPAWVSRPLIGYRVHESAMSLNTNALVTAAEMIERRYGGPLDRETLYRHMARVALRGGRHTTALRWYARASVVSRRYRTEQLNNDLRNLVRSRLHLSPRRDSCTPDGSVTEQLINEYRAEAQAWLDQLSEPRRNGSSHRSA